MVSGNQKVSSSDEDTSNYPFREVIGSLLYLLTGSRPDIAYAVKFLSHRQTQFDSNDINKVKRIFLYLAGSVDFSLKFEGAKNTIACFVDSSLGADSNGGSSCSWIIQLFGEQCVGRLNGNNMLLCPPCRG